MKAKKVAVLSLTIIILLVGAVVLVPKILHSASSQDDGDRVGLLHTVEEILSSKNKPQVALEVDGTQYARKDTTCYLFMGIDRHGDLETVDTSIGGQADTLLLLVLDKTDGQYSLIQINRDTMVEVDLLNKYGNKTDFTSVKQICLSHSFGTGDEKSCENTVRAVQRLLFSSLSSTTEDNGEDSIPAIDGYISVLFDAIPSINDTLGGIKVKIEDDFSESDPTLIMGETVELIGDHAFTFLRARMSVGDGSNISRMRRQRAYLNAFSTRLKEEMKTQSGIVDDIYEAASPYMVTDLTLSQIGNIAAQTVEMTDNGIHTYEGESVEVTNKSGKTLNEFHADMADIQRLVLDLFYFPIND